MCCFYSLIIRRLTCFNWQMSCDKMGRVMKHLCSGWKDVTKIKLLPVMCVSVIYSTATPTYHLVMGGFHVKGVFIEPSGTVADLFFCNSVTGLFIVGQKDSCGQNGFWNKQKKKKRSPIPGTDMKLLVCVMQLDYFSYRLFSRSLIIGSVFAHLSVLPTRCKAVFDTGLCSMLRAYRRIMMMIHLKLFLF